MSRVFRSVAACVALRAQAFAVARHLVEAKPGVQAAIGAAYVYRRETHGHCAVALDALLLPELANETLQDAVIDTLGRAAPLTQYGADVSTLRGWIRQFPRSIADRSLLFSVSVATACEAHSHPEHPHTNHRYYTTHLRKGHATRHPTSIVGADRIRT